MLSKSAYLILGLVQKESLNPYEIIKQLEVFQIKKLVSKLRILQYMRLSKH